MFNYNSIYKQYANTTLEWLPMDTKSLYENNLKNRYEDLFKHGWINNHFTYKFNSLGFRCDEFTSDPTIMFLGCSHTLGIGLPIDKIYPEIVSKKLNMKAANLAIGAGSADGAFRLCHGYIDKIKPKIVVLMHPPAFRFELVTDHEITNLIPEYKNSILRELIIDDNNSYFNSLKNTMAIKNICAERNIKFVLANYTDLLSDSTSLARDLAHHGAECHERFSKKLLNALEGHEGFEPPTSWFEAKHSSPLS